VPKLAAVSWRSATSCTAVGQDQSSAVTNFGMAQRLAEVGDGTAWTTAATPDRGWVAGPVDQSSDRATACQE
jgi:hypothetical protein